VILKKRTKKYWRRWR